MAATHSPAEPTSKSRRRRRLWFDPRPPGGPRAGLAGGSPNRSRTGRPALPRIWPIPTRRRPRSRPSTSLARLARGAAGGGRGEEALARLGPRARPPGSRGSSPTRPRSASRSGSGASSAPEQTLAMKVRNRPFAIYLKFLAPKAGKEVVYAEGHHDNKVIAHNGDWTRKLVPRLAVAPDSAARPGRHPPPGHRGGPGPPGQQAPPVPQARHGRRRRHRRSSTGPPTPKAGPGSDRSTPTASPTAAGRSPGSRSSTTR